MSPHVHCMLDVPATLSMALVALVYVRGWLRLRRGFPRTVAVRRLGAFMVGLASVWIAVGSPLTAFHHELLTVHMVQHVVLMAVAPPLMLMGAPALPLQYGVPWKAARRTLRQVIGSYTAQSMRRLLTHPVVCWLAPVAALIGWHVPAVFELGVHSTGWHDVQAATFLVTGLLFWLPVVHWRANLVRGWMIPVYLFAATLPCDAVSAFLVFCGRVVYPSYLSGSRLWNISPLGDQELAGALMWVAVTLIYVGPAIAITMQLLAPRATRLQDPPAEASWTIGVVSHPPPTAL
jgi:putative membrane protein